jgi:hypothetical protein
MFMKPSVDELLETFKAERRAKIIERGRSHTEYFAFCPWCGHAHDSEFERSIPLNAALPTICRCELCKRKFEITKQACFSTTRV